MTESLHTNFHTPEEMPVRTHTTLVCSDEIHPHTEQDGRRSNAILMIALTVDRLSAPFHDPLSAIHFPEMTIMRTFVALITVTAFLLGSSFVVQAATNATADSKKQAVEKKGVGWRQEQVYEGVYEKSPQDPSVKRSQ